MCVFILCLLVGWWMSPPTWHSLLAILLSSLAVSAAAAGLLVGLDRWTQPHHESGPTTPSVSPEDPVGDDKRTSLTKAVLDGLDLRFIELDYADLRQMSAVSADLTGASLVGADLRGADLSNSCLRDANLAGAILDRMTSLSGADLRGATVTRIHRSLLPNTDEEARSVACD